MKDEDYNIPEDQDYTSAVSAYDCTGLILPAPYMKKSWRLIRSFIPSAHLT